MPEGQNAVWSLDYVLHAVTDGRRFPVLAVVNHFTPEYLTLMAGKSPSGVRESYEARAETRTRKQMTTTHVGHMRSSGILRLMSSRER